METGNGEKIEMKIFSTALTGKKVEKTIIAGKAIYVPCSDNLLEITSLQPAGKKRMGAVDFINGHKNLVGDENIRFV